MAQNSWGTDNPYQGTWYFTKAFVAMKTIDIMVHKDALPKEIAKKLGIATKQHGIFIYPLHINGYAANVQSYRYFVFQTIRTAKQTVWKTVFL